MVELRSAWLKAPIMSKSKCRLKQAGCQILELLAHRLFSIQEWTCQSRISKMMASLWRWERNRKKLAQLCHLNNHLSWLTRKLKVRRFEEASSLTPKPCLKVINSTSQIPRVESLETLLNGTTSWMTSWIKSISQMIDNLLSFWWSISCQTLQELT